jgi:proline dehydrogenase
MALPLAPRPLVERVAARYMAGATVDDALRTVRELADAGILATVDVLGEEVTRPDQADATVEEYLRVLDALRRDGVAGGVSVKLSALGLLASTDAAERRLRRIVEAAGGRFVRIDMEDSSTTDATLAIHRRLRADGVTRVGVVLQAMLRRSLRDARALLDLDAPDVRVCKGIYVEPYSRAYVDPELIRRNFVLLCETLLEGGGRVAAATHDERVVYEVRRAAERLDPSGERHEFQMLLGVEPPLRELLVEAGARLRIYVPYGAESHAYALRRLQENPAVARHVLKDLRRTAADRLRSRR